MTQQEAIKTATEFARANQIEIGDAVSARLMSAQKFNDHFGERRYESDYWVVFFRRPLPPGAAAISPPIYITVEDETGKTYQEFQGLV